MDLWIRSQDKQVLRRCNSLKIEKYHDETYAISELATTYGTYKTEERAIEVINDIEKSIANRYVDTMIYELPSE